ncbi:MAG: SufD family Fe-S cluster assembly protein, partial [Candidatus Caldarchaeum sp.]
RRGVVLRVNSVNLVRFFTSLGLAGKARGKRIPGWVFKLPHQQKKALIDGYIAADGYKRDGHRNISVCSSNKKLLEDLKTLAISCGLNPLKISRWRRRERKPLGKKLKTYTHYFLYFSDIIPDSEIYFVPVKSIEPAGTRITYDIEVDGTANFIAQGLIVHNSKVTMKYPSVYLLGRGAKADILSVAFAGRGQHQDTGAKAVHLAPDTTSRITSKSVCKDGGRTSYRGLLHVAKGAKRVKSSVRCDALILDDISRTDTYPYNDINEEDTTATHEATVGKIGEEQLFYLMSRGLTEQEALNMIVLGFLEPFTKTLPMEYAVEFNRLIELEMSGSVG